MENEDSRNRSKEKAGDGEKMEISSSSGSRSLLSPGFKSVAEMAGWDEEALMLASLIVEDTPDRHTKRKKQSGLLLKSPPTSSRRKRRIQRRSPSTIPVAILNLEEDKTPIEERKIDKKKELNIDVNLDKEVLGNNLNGKGSGDSSSSSAIPCLDKLRDELSCAICLEICFEPSTTPCGHSFCKKCLRSAADKCGKRCPKCRQLISNGRSCTVNTVLWNTIQLLFPQEVEARKAATSSNSQESGHKSSAKESKPRELRNRRVLLSIDDSPESELSNLERRRINSNHHHHQLRTRSIRPPRVQISEEIVNSLRRSNRDVVVPNQDEDSALALRLQREEFMGAFRAPDESTRSTAIANLRAMASRAIDIRHLRRRRDV